MSDEKRQVSESGQPEDQAAAVVALLDQTHFSAGSRVLDCACGDGKRAAGLAGRGYNVVVLAADHAQIRRVRRETRRVWRVGKIRPAGISFRHEDILELPHDFHDAFDVIVCWDDAIARLTKPSDLKIAVLGFRTALRPGGILLFSCRKDSERRNEAQLALESAGFRDLTWIESAVGAASVLTAISPS